MLPLAGKALGVILAIFSSAYLLPFACSAVTPDGDPYPDNRQETPHFAQQYIPDNLGNEADRQIARLFNLEDCHTKKLTNDADVIHLQVETIIDGDTFVAHTNERSGQRVRLWGIDAPESDQPHGNLATAYLAQSMPVNTMVKARYMGTDQYGRILAVIGEDDELTLNWNMVLTGNAHHYDHGDSAGNICLKEAQKVAQSVRRGLWSNPDPVNPYDWRQQNRP